MGGLHTTTATEPTICNGLSEIPQTVSLNSPRTRTHLAEFLFTAMYRLVNISVKSAPGDGKKITQQLSTEKRITTKLPVFVYGIFFLVFRVDLALYEDKNAKISAHYANCSQTPTFSQISN